MTALDAQLRGLMLEVGQLGEREQELGRRLQDADWRLVDLQSELASLQTQLKDAQTQAILTQANQMGEVRGEVAMLIQASLILIRWGR